jgi:hypothetical protein
LRSPSPPPTAVQSDTLARLLCLARRALNLSASSSHRRPERTMARCRANVISNVPQCMGCLQPATKLRRSSHRDGPPRPKLHPRKQPRPARDLALPALGPPRPHHGLAGFPLRVFPSRRRSRPASPLLRSRVRQQSQRLLPVPPLQPDHLLLPRGHP